MRQVVNMNAKWAFSKEATEPPKTMPNNWYWVHLPHSWNDIDGQDGGNDYFRGTAFYAKEIEKSEFPKANEYYLELCGANSSATVYANGKEIGHHDGGYSTWRVRLTDVLTEKTLLVIAVDNASNEQVYPQSADFTFYGGLYRDVNILAVAESHFELEYYGGPGIKVTPKIVGSDANVEVEVYLANAREGQSICYTILDAEGKKVAKLLLSDENLAEAAHTLFAELRRCDEENVDFIVASAVEASDSVGFAIMNRMLKSAGYHVVRV